MRGSHRRFSATVCCDRRSRLPEPPNTACSRRRRCPRAPRLMRCRYAGNDTLHRGTKAMNGRGASQKPPGPPVGLVRLLFAIVKWPRELLADLGSGTVLVFATWRRAARCAIIVGVAVSQVGRWMGPGWLSWVLGLLAGVITFGVLDPHPLEPNPNSWAAIASAAAGGSRRWLYNRLPRDVPPLK